MKDETYSGYANYETWQVGIYIDNTETIYNRVQEKTKQLCDSFDKESAITWLTTWLRSFITVKIEGSKRKINWKEIATDNVEVYLEDKKANENEIQ